jgi:hypothetical protein
MRRSINYQRTQGSVRGMNEAYQKLNRFLDSI